MPSALLNPLLRYHWGWLLPLLLLLSGPLTAQTTPARRYWEADGDSLRRVLDTQRADTARLRTLLHIGLLKGAFRSEADYDTLFQELIQLVRRLRRPEPMSFSMPTISCSRPNREGEGTTFVVVVPI